MKKIRVYLRSFEPEDYLLLHKWRNDDEISYYASLTQRFTSTLNEKKWLEEKIFDKNNVNCAICIKETNEFIGCIFLNEIDYIRRSACGSTFIGAKEHWNKGYATEAKILMLKHAFYYKGLERIWSNVLEDNIGSLKMLEKCGYKREGLLRKASYVNGEFKNMFILSMLKEDFEEILNDYEF